MFILRTFVSTPEVCVNNVYIFQDLTRRKRTDQAVNALYCENRCVLHSHPKGKTLVSPCYNRRYLTYRYHGTLSGFAK